MLTDSAGSSAQILADFPGIIQPNEVLERLDEEPFRVVDVFNPSPQDQRFIPNALHLPTQALVRGGLPSPGKLPPQSQLEDVFGYLGYEPSQTIVVCDHEGGGWAGRLAWTLDIISHKQWLYLDGGINAWQAAGFDIVLEPRRAQPTKPSLTLNLEPLIETDELIGNLDDEHLAILDVRSREEFIGLRATAERNGHIPGAVNIDWLDLMDRVNALRLRSDVKELFAEQGITPDRDVVTYCQTHHRSGLSYMAARLLGFPSVRAYAGSWSEWGNRTDTPIEQ